MPVQLSLSLRFYLLYLLLNSCDGNDAFWGYSMLVKQSSSFSRKHRTSSHLSRSVSAKQSGWVHCTNTCPWHQPQWSVTWSSASLTHGQAQALSQNNHWLSEPTDYTTGSFQSHQQSAEEITLFRVISIAAI